MLRKIRAHLDVYGKIKDKTGSFDNEITYTGRWLDEDTGLYYYRARWYNADRGRFISRDPIGTDGGINLYGYVEGNPVNFGDPLGLQAMFPLLPNESVFIFNSINSLKAKKLKSVKKEIIKVWLLERIWLEY